MFFCNPIRKLLVLINQSSYLIYFRYNFFDIANETNICEIKLKRLRLQILTCFIFVLLFSKNITVSLKMLFEEELDGIHIDDIRNLEDLPRLVFINDEFENLIANDSEKLTRNIN